MSYTSGLVPPDVHDITYAATDAWAPTGWLAATYDRMTIPSTNSATELTSATARFTGIYLPTGITVTNAVTVNGAVAVGPANGWVALYDFSLNVIRQATDITTTLWGTNTTRSWPLDSIPVTAGARVASTTVTLTFPTLSQSLTSLIAVGDSVTVSNANIVAYNGTFTVVTVSATQITYVSGGSATDSLVAPFPTVQLAAGKRTYAPTAGKYYIALMQKVGTSTSGLVVSSSATGATSLVPISNGNDATNNALTGTAISPAAALTANAHPPLVGIT